MNSCHRLVLAISLLSLNVHGQTAVAAAVAQEAKVIDTTVQLPAGKVFYRDGGGEGIAVVFLHAGSGNSMLWEHQIAPVRAAGYRFIAIDYRGVASGDTPGPRGGASPALIDQLVGRLALGRFHLVGTAAGGGVALQYALLHPEKLRSVTVSNSIGNVQDSDYAALGKRLRPEPHFNQLPLDFRELGPSYRAADPEGVARWLALSSEGRSGGLGPPPPFTTAGAPAPDAVTWQKLEALAVPVLLMTGDADLYTPPAVLRMFAARMKQAESVVISESGHSAYWEQPEAFNRHLLMFLRNH